MISVINGWKAGLRDKSVEMYHSTLIKGRKNNASVVVSKHSFDDWRVLVYSPDEKEYSKWFSFTTKTKARKFAKKYMEEWSKSYLNKY